MKTRFYPFLLVAVLFFTTLVPATLAQTDDPTFITITGTVKDARTKRPVSFANVYVPNTHIGTVANIDGDFTLKIQKSLNATSIGISHLGYRVASFSIEGRSSGQHEFLIEPHSITLQEVLVRPQNPRELIYRALEKRPENYATTPYMLTGFYRETIRQRRDYISISEAIINMYQSPIDAMVSQDRVKIVQGRKSANVKKADTLLLKLQGGPQVSIMLDVVRNADLLISPQTIDFYDYEFLDIVMIEDRTNYVIGFKPRLILPFALFEGKLYLEAENLAITMAEFSLDLSDRTKATQSFVLRKPARLRFTPTNTRYLVTYQEIDGKYHLNYIRSELEFFADWRRRLFRTGYTVMLEMAVTERVTGDIQPFPLREAFNPRSIFADMVPVYFEDDFWGDYNYIEPDQTIESAIRKLNRVFEREQSMNQQE
ncbi:MAG: carboxypeptidase-like regulatory domain-containing protein [Bacteroidales bacterium]